MRPLGAGHGPDCKPPVGTPHPDRMGYMGDIAEEIRRPYTEGELWQMFGPWMFNRDIVNLSPREVRLLASIDALRAGVALMMAHAKYDPVHSPSWDTLAKSLDRVQEHGARALRGLRPKDA